MPGELTLNVALHRHAYLSIPNQQQAYFLLDILQSPPLAVAPTRSINFCLVLDRSGSMAGEKLRQVKKAAKRVVKRLTKKDTLSIVIFDESAEVVLSANLVQDPDEVNHRIDSILERGGTRMSSGMQVGLNELSRFSNMDRVNRMLLLTDGRTWEDSHLCLQIADQFGEAGIPISVLGFAEGDWDPAFLEEIAIRSGGDWIAIEEPGKISSIFESTVKELQGTTVTNAVLTMRFVQGVKLQAIWRVKPLISRLRTRQISRREAQIFLGDIQYCAGLSILADVLFPPRPIGLYRLAQADITYDVPGSDLSRQRQDLDVVVLYTEDSNLSERLNPRLMNIIERVLTHKLQTQALDDAAFGDIQHATQRLRAAAIKLLDLGESEMAQLARVQADKLQETGRIDHDAAQQMRYKTKMLTGSTKEF